MRVVFGSRKKEIKCVFSNAPRHGPLPPRSISLTGWSSSAEQACLCSTLMLLQRAEIFDLCLLSQELSGIVKLDQSVIKCYRFFTQSAPFLGIFSFCFCAWECVWKKMNLPELSPSIQPLMMEELKSSAHKSDTATPNCSKHAKLRQNWAQHMQINLHLIQLKFCILLLDLTFQYFLRLAWLPAFVCVEVFLGRLCQTSLGCTGVEQGS